MKSVRTAAAIALLAGVFAGVPAHASPAVSADEPLKPGETRGSGVSDEGPSEAIFARQAVLDKIADRVYKYVDPFESGRPASTDGFKNNYADLTIDPEANRLDLWWKGPVPSTILSAIAAPAGVEVSVHDASFSLGDLVSTSDALQALLKSPVSGLQAKWETITPQGRLGRLKLTLSGQTELPLQATVGKALQLATPVPLAVEWATNTAGKLYGQSGRQDDQSPWYGGGGMLLNFPDGVGYCSTGIPIRTASGNEYVTTGRHCILNETNNNYRAISGTADVPSGNRSIGEYNERTAWNEPSYDTTLIDPSSNDVSPHVWTGAYNSTTSQLVTSIQTSTIGDFVCISGARSGSNCSDKITDKNAVTSFKGATLAGNVSVTAQSGIASAPGDSGGPVWYSAGGSLYLKGTLIGGLNNVSCPSGKLYDTAEFGNTGCSSRSVYASGPGMVNAFDATLAP